MLTFGNRVARAVVGMIICAYVASTRLPNKAPKIKKKKKNWNKPFSEIGAFFCLQFMELTRFEILGIFSCV